MFLVELQPERDASTDVHVLPELTANSDVISTSASVSRDLVGLTPKIADKELEKVPAKKALNIFQEKRKCSYAEDARPVKIAKFANSVVVPMASKQQTISQSGSRMAHISIALKNLPAKNAVKIISEKSIPSSNQPGTLRESISQPTRRYFSQTYDDVFLFFSFTRFIIIAVVLRLAINSKLDADPTVLSKLMN